MTETRGRPRNPLHSIAGVPAKPCPRCHSVKPLEEFPPLSGGAHGRHSWCRPCWNLYQKSYRKRQPTKDDPIQTIDAEPLTDREFLLRRERMWREAKEEGPRYCACCSCKLRLDNRRRGTCDPCASKAMSA
jgi:hypothetical protein